MALFSRRSAHADTAPPMPRLRDVDERELEWIAAHVELVTDTGASLDDAAQIRSVYERWAAGWHRINPPERNDPNTMINAIGTALGEHLARRTPLGWMIATDEHSTELALYEPRSRTLLYPANVVAKRWVAEEPGEFITAIAGRLTTQFPAPRARRRS